MLNDFHISMNSGPENAEFFSVLNCFMDDLFIINNCKCDGHDATTRGFLARNWLTPLCAMFVHDSQDKKTEIYLLIT